MINWILGGVIVLISALIIRQMIKDKKAGKGSCGCDCSKCHRACSCQPK